MASAPGTPTKVAFDSSAIIGFDDSDVDMLGEMHGYFRGSNHVMVICNAVWNECRFLRDAFVESNECKRVRTNDATFQAVRALCHPVPTLRGVQDNDFRVIASAVDEGCTYLVSNDGGQIEATSRYAQRKRINVRPLSVANFLYYMYSVRRDLFPWKMNIKKVTNFYHYVEIKNMFDGITDPARHWDLAISRNRFAPYAKNIYQTVDGLP